jgi:ABC-type nickel/cobalt efflux system permease component RcnA
MNARTTLLLPCPIRFRRLLAMLALLALPFAAAAEEPSPQMETTHRMQELPVFEHSEPATGAGRALSRLERRLDGRLGAYLKELAAGGSIQLWLLLGLVSLLFGVVHAVLPGHRKLLLFSYFLAEDARPLQGLVAGVTVAALQVLSAAVLVLVGSATAGGSMASALETATPWLQRVTGVAMIAVAAAVLALRLIEFFRTRGDWRAQYFISKLSSVDSRIDPDNEDPALHLAVAHARRLRRRRRADAPWLPAIIIAGIVPCPAAALVLSRALTLGVPLAGLLAIVGVTLGAAVVLSVLSLVTIVAKERGIDMLGGRAGHYTHLGVEVAGAAVMLALGVTLVTLLGG